MSKTPDESAGQVPAQGTDRTRRIRAQNDEFRTAGGFSKLPGRWTLTQGINGKGTAFVASVVAIVREFSTFTEDNDPHGEHDFGAFDVAGERCFWKIDYYNLTLDGGSPDPADPVVTYRVLTILLASEY